MITSEHELRRTWLAVLAAELDGDQERSAMLLRQSDDPEFAVGVATYSARWMAVTFATISPDVLEDFRAVIAADLLSLAAEPHASGQVT